MTEIANRYRWLASFFTQHVEAVPAHRWGNPSPCSGWTARDVLRHVIDAHQARAQEVGLPLEVAVTVDDDPHRAWIQTRDGMQALLEDPESACREFEGFLGTTSLQDTVDLFLRFDLVVHAWDLARATGQDETLPIDEVRWVHEQARQLEERLPQMRGMAFGERVEVPADATEQDQLLAFLGRAP